LGPPTSWAGEVVGSVGGDQPMPSFGSDAPRSRRVDDPVLRGAMSLDSFQVEIVAERLPDKEAGATIAGQHRATLEEIAGGKNLTPRQGVATISSPLALYLAQPTLLVDLGRRAKKGFCPARACRGQVLEGLFLKLGDPKDLRIKKAGGGFWPSTPTQVGLNIGAVFPLSGCGKHRRSRWDFHISISFADDRLILPLVRASGRLDRPIHHTVNR